MATKDDVVGMSVLDVSDKVVPEGQIDVIVVDTESAADTGSAADVSVVAVGTILVVVLCTSVPDDVPMNMVLSLDSILLKYGVV